eukprot:6180136-Pleurochrysis_carterae.AAC.6
MGNYTTFDLQSRKIARCKKRRTASQCGDERFLSVVSFVEQGGKFAVRSLLCGLGRSLARLAFAMDRTQARAPHDAEYGARRGGAQRST